MKIYILIIITIISFFSCRISKRKHREGYHIERVELRENNEKKDSINFETKYPHWNRDILYGYSIGSGINTMISGHAFGQYNFIGGYFDIIFGKIDYYSAGGYIDPLIRTNRQSLCIGSSIELNPKIKYKYFFPNKEKSGGYSVGFEYFYARKKQYNQYTSNQNTDPTPFYTFQLTIGYVIGDY